VAGHQPPRPLAAGPLQPPAPRENPAGSLQTSTTREPPAGSLRPPTTPAKLQPSAAGPRRSKPQERPHVSVGRPKCTANKNNDKIYQMK
jgi:hypothetical protein